jgi:CHAT domain-containing protein/Tfp pilus assembly protein PilF
MTLALRLRVVTCLSIGLLVAVTAAGGQSGSLKDQITQYEQKLADARTKKDLKNVAVELTTLGELYRESGNTDKALDDYNQALAIEHNGGSRGYEALTQDYIGQVYTDLGQEQKALDLFNQALPVMREMGNRLGEELTLWNIGRTYSNLAQEDKALDFLNQALTISREAGSLKGQAGALDAIGKVYSDMSRGPESINYLNQALELWRKQGSRAGEALTLWNIGRAYADMGQKQKSFEAYNQALAIWRDVGNRQGEASTLNYMGRVYSDLGQKQQALDYYSQALPIWREVGNRNGEALILNDIGRAHSDIGETQKALDFYTEALTMWRKAGNRRGEAMTLSNMGIAWLKQGQLDKALEVDFESLPVWREVKESRGEAMALIVIGRVYAQQGQPQQAYLYSLAALSLVKAAGDPDMEGGIDTAMMVGFRNQNLPEEAIFYGMDGVNAYQQIRKNISGLDKDMQAGFAQSKAMTYRTLAELLIEAGRLGEAEQVLDLLKEQELKDIVRGASADAGANALPLTLSPAQQKVESEMAIPEKRAVEIENLSLQYAILQTKTSRTAAEDAQLKSLIASVAQGVAEIQIYLTGTIYPALEAKSGVGKGSESSNGEGSTQSYLQNTLAKLGPNVMGIRLLLGENHAYAILATASTRKKYELKATSAEIRSKAFEVLENLASRTSDPRPRLAELYAMIVAPVEGELKTLETPAAQGRAPTLLWSLDGALRYLPMAALYDGHRYMLERFNNVLFTPESYGHMTDSPLTNGTAPSVLAMGLSKSYGGLPPLPGVMPELESVVHDPAVPESHGPMEGKLLPNEQFTLAALRAELGSGKSFSVVHIASHFVEEAGSGAQPFLLMGGQDAGEAQGYEWNLADMENSSIAFHGTRLLTLSACSTAKDYQSRDGIEMDSLGMVAQQKDAEAVLATLWDVNDASTSQLMSDFYSRWVRNPAAGKAEALRQAQLALLHAATGGPNATKQRGPQLEQGETSTARESTYSHPFFWAPFVLIGNYQ